MSNMVHIFGMNRWKEHTIMINRVTVQTNFSRITLVILQVDTVTCKLGVETRVYRCTISSWGIKMSRLIFFSSTLMFNPLLLRSFESADRYEMDQNFVALNMQSYHPSTSSKSYTPMSTQVLPMAGLVYQKQGGLWP